MAGQYLHVPQRASDRRDFPRRVGNEGSSPTVAGAAVEPEVPVPLLKQVYDHLRTGLQRPLGADHVRAGVRQDLHPIVDEGRPQVLIQGNDSTTRSTLGGDVLQQQRT